jgi:hypothetical protein
MISARFISGEEDADIYDELAPSTRRRVPTGCREETTRQAWQLLTLRDNNRRDDIIDDDNDDDEES